LDDDPLHHCQQMPNTQHW